MESPPYKMITSLPPTLISLLLVISASVSAQPATTRDEYFNHTPTISGSLLAVVSVLVVVMFLVGFLALCFSRRALTAAPDGITRQQLRRAAPARGLDASILQSLPTFVYADVKGLKLGKGALECAVCLCEFEDDETLRLIPKCDHVFHTDCIDAWLKSHVTCPVCRADLTEAVQTKEDDIEAQTESVGVESCSGLREPEAGAQTGNQSQPRGELLRSHTTGHSLVQNTERFTLRLPEEVRKQIVAPAGEEGSRRGSLRVRSERWLRKTHSFLWRIPSMRSPKVAAESGEGTSVQPAKPELGSSDSVRIPV